MASLFVKRRRPLGNIAQRDLINLTTPNCVICDLVVLGIISICTLLESGQISLIEENPEEAAAKSRLDYHLKKSRERH